MKALAIILALCASPASAQMLWEPFDDDDQWPVWTVQNLYNACPDPFFVDTYDDRYRVAHDAGDWWTCAVLFVEMKTVISVRVDAGTVRETSALFPNMDPRVAFGYPWADWLQVAWIAHAERRGMITIEDPQLRQTIESMERNLFPALEVKP